MYCGENCSFIVTVYKSMMIKPFHLEEMLLQHQLYDTFVVQVIDTYYKLFSNYNFIKSKAKIASILMYYEILTP